MRHIEETTQATRYIRRAQFQQLVGYDAAMVLNYYSASQDSLAGI